MLLINASNLYVGGGVQVAVSIIDELSKINYPFYAAVSPVVEKQLSDFAKETIIPISKSPSGLFNSSIRKELDDVVINKNITVVFTVFGPSYWNPTNVRHVVGFALPWLIYDTRNIYRFLSVKEKMKTQLLKYLQPHFYKKNADAIITETDDATRKVTQLLDFPQSKVYTVSNTLNSIFRRKEQHDYSIYSKLPEKNHNDIWLLTISHDYPHKNLKVIYELVKILPENYKFVVTLDDSFVAGVESKYAERIITLDYVTLAQCPPLYFHCDALFLPTLLECFSSSYLEAMYSGKLILTSDFSFTRTVCNDSAVYFDPYDAVDIANKIKYSFDNESIRLEKISSGYEQLSKFPDAKERMEKYLSILTQV